MKYTLIDKKNIFSFLQENLNGQLYHNMLDTLIYFHIIDIVEQEEKSNENELMTGHFLIMMLPMSIPWWQFLEALERTEELWDNWRGLQILHS